MQQFCMKQQSFYIGGFIIKIFAGKWQFLHQSIQSYDQIYKKRTKQGSCEPERRTNDTNAT